MAGQDSKPDPTNFDNPSKTGVSTAQSQGSDRKIDADHSNPNNHTVPFGGVKPAEPKKSKTITVDGNKVDEETWELARRQTEDMGGLNAQDEKTSNIAIKKTYDQITGTAGEVESSMGLTANKDLNEKQ